MTTFDHFEPHLDGTLADAGIVFGLLLLGSLENRIRDWVLLPETLRRMPAVGELIV